MSSTSPEAIFSADKNVIRDGGRFVVEDSDFPSLGSFFASFRARAITSIDQATTAIRPGWPRPWVHFDFVNNTLLDATAFRSKDHYFIGVNMGTPLLLFDIFNRMLSCSHVFNFIGNSAAEASVLSSVPKLYSDADFIEQIVEDGSVRHAFVIPKDPVRAEFANFLTHMAMDFLVSHEFFHIAMGHLLLSEQEGGLPLMSEARWQASKGETSILQQALEWDADHQATRFEVFRLFATCDDLDRRVPKKWRSFFKGYNANLYIWCFAINTLFHLMGEYQMEKLPSSSHPPPSIREQAVSASVRQTVSHKRPYLLKGFDKMKCGFIDTGQTHNGLGLCAGLHVLHLVMYLTGAEKLDVAELRRAEEEQGHFDMVIAELNSIRLKLRPIMQSLGVKYEYPP